MKKRIFSLLLASVVLCSLRGCRGKDGEVHPVQAETDGNASDSGNKADGGTNENEIETGQDYSLFEMPDATDTLTVYSAGMQTKTMGPAVEIFQTLYPDVKVELHRLEEEEFEARIRTEIAAGKGPDLLYASGSDLPDIYKTVSTGVFEDLNPYIESDDEFNLNDYIEGFADGSLFQGKRYFFPVSHFPPILVTTEETLREIGIATDELSTYAGFLDACMRFHDAYPESNFVADTGPYDLEQSNLVDLYNFCGFFPINYENRTVSLDESAFRKMVDVCRLYAGNDPNKDDVTNGEYVMYRAVLERECLFSQFGNNSLMLQLTLMGMESGGETPFLFTPPCAYGGKATVIQTFGAIPKNSPNKRNAWRLLKILLSDEIQGNPDTLFAVDPVRKSAVPLFLNHWNSDGWVEENIPGLKEILLDFDRAHLHQPLISQYVRDSMLPYITGSAAYEDRFKKLLNTLELYASE